MKKILIATLLLISTQANGYEGGQQSTFSPNLDSRELENAVKYEYLKDEYDTKLTYSDGLTKCAAKNQYYMPGNGSADSDGCYDVLGYLNNMGLSGTEATYAGAITSTDGDFANDVTYADGYWAADKHCTDTYSGSRAARESDYKYFIHDENSSIPNYARWFAFDAIKATTGTGDLQVFGYGTWDTTALSGYECGSYDNNSSSYYTPKFTTTDGGFQYGFVDCSNTTYIMCVFD